MHSSPVLICIVEELCEIYELVDFLLDRVPDALNDLICLRRCSHDVVALCRRQRRSHRREYRVLHCPRWNSASGKRRELGYSLLCPAPYLQQQLVALALSLGTPAFLLWRVASN
jgi:hypothetical protein